MINYKDYITVVPDFPEKGISFKDISPLLANSKVFREVIYNMGKLVAIKPTKPPFITRYPDYWIGIDARGFIFASALAIHFGGGVVMFSFLISLALSWTCFSFAILTPIFASPSLYFDLSSFI